MTTRKDIIERIKQKPEVSVLVIGGGVNGIGTFRDLALQGVDVLLVEKNDFCSGASAASSHMAHGGIRYLENGEFRLVREALTERNRLIHNAPHYVKPAPTTVPIFKWFSGFLNAPLKFLDWRDKPSERGVLVIKIGMMFYDWFTRGQQGLPTHKLFGRSESLLKRPGLNQDILFTAQYYDAWLTCPERICLEMIADAEAANPNARALNYTAATGLQNGAITLRDEVTGEVVTVKPRLVINAAGPWIDFTNNALGKRTEMIGGTKGSHIIVDHPELHAMTGGNEFFFENKDGRITLFFPFGDKVMVGTTDIRVDTPDIVIDDAEIDYMLQLVTHVFPSVKLDRSHIVFKFTGVRPLPNSKASSTGQISRDHLIEVVQPDANRPFPVYSLVSGKWTTFRAFAEQAADKALDFLKQGRKFTTENTPIGGGHDYPTTDVAREAWLNDQHAKTGVAVDRLQELFIRYGTYAAEIAAHCVAGADRPLQHLPAFSAREIEFITLRERVLHLDDFILRRSLIAMLGQMQAGLLDELAGIIGATLGWNDAQRRQEINRTADILQTKHGVAAGKL